MKGFAEHPAEWTHSGAWTIVDSSLTNISSSAKFQSRSRRLKLPEEWTFFVKMAETCKDMWSCQNVFKNLPGFQLEGESRVQNSEIFSLHEFERRWITDLTSLLAGIASMLHWLEDSVCKYQEVENGGKFWWGSLDTTIRGLNWSIAMACRWGPYFGRIDGGKPHNKLQDIVAFEGFFGCAWATPSTKSETLEAATTTRRGRQSTGCEPM